MASSQKPKEWKTTISDQEYLISTDVNSISHDFVNNAYGSDDMYWAKAMPAAILRNILSNSLVMGVYAVQPSFPAAKTAEEPSSPETPSPTLEAPDFYFSNEFERNGAGAEKLEQVGFARFVTDHVTVFYLTDVYVEPDSRGRGLGKWLISCCREILDSKPHLMRAMLMASPGEGKEFYEKALAMRDIREEIAEGHTVPMTRGRKQ
jgi:GNAT superfamily N-acetyltransferase